MAIKPVLTVALDVRGREQISPPHVGQWVHHEIEHAWSVKAVLRNSCLLTEKPEVMRVRRPIVRNRDCLSPLACVVGLPEM
jgi:hypothetical protein